MKELNKEIERHPLEPFLPEGAKILMLGSFPPKKERWSMDFFYPNFINDMWRIIGTIFFSDKDHFLVPSLCRTRSKEEKKFDRERIIRFCTEKGIALYDTASEVIRLQDNASDKFLEVVTPTDLHAMLKKIPECRAIVTTGEKASGTVSETFGCEIPKTGEYTEIPEHGLKFYRMPSSSRAYPLPLDKKAEVYRAMFSDLEIL